MNRTAIDMFSGVGGFTFACQWAGVETIAFVETDNYASQILNARFAGIPNLGSVKDYAALRAFERSPWLLTAGVPCQPASVAGKRLGAEDDRWLWPEALAAVECFRPTWSIFENPLDLLTLNNGVEFEHICLALESLHYEVQPFAIPACAVGANHRRQRLWLLAHANSDGMERRWNSGNVSEDRQGRTGSQAHLFHQKEFALGFESGRESELIRADARLPNWAHRVRCVGNSACPQVAYQVIKRMTESES